MQLAWDLLKSNTCYNHDLFYQNVTVCKLSQASCLLLQDENASFLVVLMMMIILDDFCWAQKNAAVSIRLLCLLTMVIWVVEFSRQGYKVRKAKNQYPQIDIMASCKKRQNLTFKVNFLRQESK